MFQFLRFALLTISYLVWLFFFWTSRLVLPLLCKDMVDVLDNSSNTTNHSSLSDYAFLYGVFPTAPSVAIYAVYYNAELEVVSELQLNFVICLECIFLKLSWTCFSLWQVTAGMVISTFLSAPIMYVSAWLLTIHLMDPQCLMNSLESVSFNISIVSLVALVSDCVTCTDSFITNCTPDCSLVSLFSFYSPKKWIGNFWNYQSIVLNKSTQFSVWITFLSLAHSSFF